MKLLIVGATGSVGRLLVEQALSQSHTITALVRNPTAFADLNHLNVRIVRGDVLNPAVVEQVVGGQDAVLCALGDGRKGKVRSAGTRNLIRSMEQTGVQRLIVQSTLGAGDSRGNLNFFWKYVMFGLLLRDAFADHKRQEESVRQSRLDWTIIRPGAFTDGTRTGQYRHGFSASDKTISLKISRADVADFMLKQLTDATYRHKTPGLSY